MADVDPADLDAAVRMTVGEAGNQGVTGRQAVAAVARNRAALTGQSIHDVVTAPGQFEGMSSRVARSLTPDSPLYQQTAAEIGPVLSGDAPDPTNGATHFLNPDLQVREGRRIPDWASGGDGQRIGAHVFFSKPALISDNTPMPSPDAVLSGYGTAPAAPAAPAAPGQAAPAAATTDTADAMPAPNDVLGGYGKPQPGTGAVTYGARGQTASAAAEATVKAMAAKGQWDPTTPPGSDTNPFIQGPDIPPAPAGAATIDLVSGRLTPAAAPGAKATAIDTAKGFGSGNLRGWFGLADQMNPLAAPFRAGENYLASQGHPVPNALKAVLPGGEGVIADYLGAGYRPTTQLGQASQFVGENTPNAFFPAAGGERAGLQIGQRALNVMLPAAGETGMNALADRYQAPAPVRTGMVIAGGLAGGAAAGLGSLAAPAVVDAVKTSTAPFRAAASTASAERQAGQAVLSHATDPAAVRVSIASGADEIVPGSTPTLGQQTGDTGILAHERGVEVHNRAAFADVRAAQNAARVGALGGIQSGGDPQAVAKSVTDAFDQLDADHAQAVEAATARAQAAGEAIGGQNSPEAAGAALRTAVGDAEQASKARYGALYQAIDPDGKLTANVVATKAAARDIIAAEPPTAAPISGEEAGIYAAAQAMPDVAPARDLMALKVRVNDAAAAELRQNGRTAAYARLQQLRSAVNQNLSTTVADAVQSDQAAVAAGQMVPENTTLARYADVLGQWKRDWANARAGVGGDASGSAAGTTSSVSSVGGAGVSSAGGPGSVAGDSGLPGAPGQPTFDDAATARLKTADTAYAAHARTFGVRPVDQALRTNGYAGDFTLPDGSVPALYFHPGPNGFGDVQAALKASNGEALPVLEDYAASSLRRAAGNADGTIDPGKFARWRAGHADALRALPPETQARFTDAASAGQAVADAAVARAAALKASQKAASAPFLNVTDPDQVTKTVGAMFGKANSTSQMRQLAQAVRGNPEAVAGLRQAIADHITSNLLSNTEVGASGVAGIKSDTYQTFLKTNRAALAQVFTPEELRSMDAVAADLQRTNRSVTAVKTPGSPNTAHDTAAGEKAGPGKSARSLLDVLGATLGMAAGYHLGHTPGAHMIGGGLGSALGGRAAALTSDVLIVETHCDLEFITQPAMVYYPNSELGNDPSNWWGPNVPMMLALLRGHGFSRVDAVSIMGGRAIFHAWRSDRLRMNAPRVGKPLPDDSHVQWAKRTKGWRLLMEGLGLASPRT